MRLFDRREAVTIEDFCQDFYDAQVFFSASDSKYMPAPGGVPGMHKVFWDGILEGLYESDPVYSELDEAQFMHEWTAFRLEMFGTAWSHLFKHKEAIMMPQTVFTRDYLTTNGHADIWETMAEYCKAIAKGGEWQLAQAYGYFPNRPEHIMQAAIVTHTKTRVKVFERMIKAGTDGMCAARFANRLGSHAGWQMSMGLAPVVALFTDRLDIDLESAGRDYLMHTARMVYEGTQSMTERVKIVPSR